MVHPRRVIFSLVRSRYIIVVLVMFLTVGLINMYESFTETSLPLNRETFIDRMVISKPDKKMPELVDVAPLPGEKKEFLQQKEDEPDDVDLDIVYKKRREVVKRVCRDMDIQARPVETWATQMHKIRTLNVTYCEVAQSRVLWMKTTEIWMRGKKVLRSSANIDDKKFENSKSEFKVDSPPRLASFQNTLSTTTKIIFTRNPFSQLFEFYVDNIFVPSLDTLNIRQRIVSRMRLKASAKDISCAHDISFSTFFEFFMNNRGLFKIAGNLAYCDVCGINFDIIGNDETIEQDIRYVYNKVKDITTPTSDIEDFGQEYVFGRIQTFIQTIFLRKDEVKCMSPHVLFMRLWRQLQIYGYINKTIDYPFTRNASSTLDEATLSNAVFKAFHVSAPDSYSNTHEAMSQAFMPIPLSDIHLGRKVFEFEFFMFGYQDRPSFLFFKQGPQYDFNYYDILPLRE